MVRPRKKNTLVSCSIRIDPRMNKALKESGNSLSRLSRELLEIHLDRMGLEWEE